MLPRWKLFQYLTVLASIPGGELRYLNLCRDYCSADSLLGFEFPPNVLLPQ